ncbi:MAG: hypothetical protein HRT86_09945 [Ilumatobacteraceae bacterium]|nr:hypothetical protein [Ilumatobacteraceae bacterium]
MQRILRERRPKLIESSPFKVEVVHATRRRRPQVDLRSHDREMTKEMSALIDFVAAGISRE